VNAIPLPPEGGSPLARNLVSEPGTGRIWRKLTEAEAREHATRAPGEAAHVV